MSIKCVLELPLNCFSCTRAVYTSGTVLLSVYQRIVLCLYTLCACLHYVAEGVAAAGTHTHTHTHTRTHTHSEVREGLHVCLLGPSCVSMAQGSAWQLYITTQVAILQLP